MKSGELKERFDMLNKALCILSGGLDSAACLGWAVNNYNEVSTIFFNYGQKTYSREAKCVKKLTQHFEIKDNQVIDIPWLSGFGVSGLFNQDTFLDESNEKNEYVPFRNSIMLSIATAYAESEKMDAIVIGSTGGDHICPDNSPDFITAFQELIKNGTMIKTDITIEAPLINGDKVTSIELATENNVPLQHTWSCHNNIEFACGQCSNCRSRLDAFSIVSKDDPIKYERQ